MVALWSPGLQAAGRLGLFLFPFSFLFLQKGKVITTDNHLFKKVYKNKLHFKDFFLKKSVLFYYCAYACVLICLCTDVCSWPKNAEKGVRYAGPGVTVNCFKR